MRRAALAFPLLLAMAACGPGSAPEAGDAAPPALALAGPELTGTDEPFAAQAVYFVVTDRFVNGDPSNDHRDQGGAHPTFDLPIECPDGIGGNVGYLGGDFRGVLDNAGYIRDLGFTAVWITPVVDNPDEALTGGDVISCDSSLTDRGKTGYHGYWGTNFHELDEHLPSEGLDFAAFTAGMREAGLKTVLDIVANHGSPAYTMPETQPGYGQVFDAEGTLVADHQNLHPSELDPEGEPLHSYYNTAPDLAQLADFDEANPEVMDYLVGAYLQWIGQGADAFRIDTIRHMPHPFWKEFSDRIRAEHPGFYMFAEAFNYEAEAIAEHTLPANGGVSVLDFPMKQAMDEVFAGGAGFERLEPALHLEGGPYHNVYELATFYDNHDMPRMDASDEGFIDAHNWLFTARGIPVVYYGSEIGFMRGRGEHAGNRNYFGQERVDAAPAHPIHQSLRRIAQVRRDSLALQRGLHVNLRLEGDEAMFYRVHESADAAQTALVVLNKGDVPARVELGEMPEADGWVDGFDSAAVDPGADASIDVPAHGVRVLLRNAPLSEDGRRILGL